MFFKVLAITILIGVVAGSVSRWFLAASMSNAEIIKSPLGLIALVVIAFGLSFITMGWKSKSGRPFVLGVLMLAGGIMWVIPWSLSSLG